MSMLRRVGLSRLRTLRPKAGHSEESWWAQGKQEKVPGYLFNETPPPPGQKRKWEGWEAPWYFMLASMGVFAFIIMPSRPDTDPTTWAKKKAIKELKEEGLPF